MEPRENSERKHRAEYRAERRVQVRALVVLALALLLWFGWRAWAAGLFHPGWWRL